MELCGVYCPGIWISQHGFPASKGPIIREFVGVYYDKQKVPFLGSLKADFVKSELNAVVVQDEPVHKINVGVV